MDLLIPLLILGAIGAAYYFWRRSNSPAASAGPPAPVIENVRPGGTVQLRGVGPDLEDFDLVIKARHTYDEDGWKWFELEGEKGTQPVWIEIEQDDETEISICLEKLKLSDLGVTGPDVEAIAAKGKGQIRFRDMDFTYEEDGKARFFRDSDLSGAGEPFHYWDFESGDGRHYLAIERWGSAEYLAYLSEPLRPAQIEVFSVS
jgi:hypothetical protein